jgi:hypothetical protein
MNSNLHFEYYVGYCPLPDAYLIRTTFLEVALLPSSGDFLSLH